MGININGFDVTQDDKGRYIFRGDDNVQISNGIDFNGQPILMYGYGGDDRLITGYAADEIYGGEGNDYIDGRDGVDKLVGGNGNDLYVVDLTASGGLQDKITESSGATSGIDTLKLRGVVDLLKPVTINLVANVENLDASDTASTLLNLTGNKLDNSLIGNDADNVINGGKGLDTFAGGKGDDVYVLDQAAELNNITEYSDAGSGADTLLITYANTSKTLAFEVNLGISNLANVENVTLVSKGLFNIAGNNLDNVLTGNASINNLNGGDGNDVLIGGLGNDVLTGGAGADAFVFDTKLSKTNIDTITGFQHGVDKIQLDTDVFKKLLGDNDFSDNLSTDGVAHDINDYLVYNNATGALFYDADGSGKGAAVQFASLAGNPALDATDFAQWASVKSLSWEAALDEIDSANSTILA